VENPFIFGEDRVAIPKPAIAPEVLIQGYKNVPIDRPDSCDILKVENCIRPTPLPGFLPAAVHP
jgi:hypothetical protein